MKIYFVANTGFFIYNFFLRLAKALKYAGCDIAVVSPEDEYSEKLKDIGFTIIPLTSMNRKGSNPVEDISLLIELYKIFKHGKPDLVLLFTIKINVYGGIAALFANVKSLCTVTGLGWLFTKKSIKTAIGGTGYKIMYKIAFAHAKKVFFQNADDREFFLRNRVVKHEKTLVTPGVGVDVTHFSPDFCYSTTDKQHDKHVFLLIARILWDKGIGEFVEAAKIVKSKFPSTEFWLLGPMDYENRSAIADDVVKGWVDEGFIKYLGKTYDVRSFICQSDMVVLPSYREAIGKSLLEAMSMGKPIIATDTAGCKETVEDGKNGFLVPVRDTEALSEAMIKFIKLTQADKEKMGKYSREKAVREFDENIVVNVYRKIIEDASDKNI